MACKKLKPLLWRTTAREPACLFFGVEHLADDWERRLPKDLLKAFDSSDRLCVEIDTARVSKAQVKKALRRVTPPSDVSDALRGQAELAAEKIAARGGVTTSSLTGEDPVAAACVSLGLDGWLMTRARKTEKPIISLETFNEQLVALEAVVGPGEESTRALSSASAMTHELHRAFLSRDLDFFAYLVSLNFSPRSAAWTERHVNMAQRLLRLFSKEPKSSFFVAIGLTHLLGPGNVIDLLSRVGGVPIKKVGW